MTQNKGITLHCYHLVLDNGTMKTMFLNNQELAGYKRSAEYKRRLSFKCLATVIVNIKIKMK